ncbi:MAG TPA: metallophosphoesterase [Pirellulales bacterium]|nr:metallophosphoesterase [Pirellulales bacterium]
MPIAALILFTLFGHAAIWVGLANRLHASLVPNWFNKLASYVCHGMLVLLPMAAAAAWLLMRGGVIPSDSRGESSHWPAVCAAYLDLCWLVGGLYGLWWIMWRLTARVTHRLLPQSTRRVDVSAIVPSPAATGLVGKLVGLVPGNQVRQIQIEEKELVLPALPRPLDGFSIAHVSDWHLKGRLARSYYEAAVRETNALGCDLIALTGDLFDRAELLSWIPETFAKLRAPQGVYFIFGNHDVRHDLTEKARAELEAAGLIYLGREARTIAVRGQTILLAGNEQPWLPQAELPPSTADLRILLAHSPDQFRWARRRQFDLMLAGHTHGGQVRLPLVGAIYSPSWHGVKYAQGTFYTAPTVLHVTRGIGCEVPLRLNCPPEIAKLVLRAEC